MKNDTSVSRGWRGPEDTATGAGDTHRQWQEGQICTQTASGQDRKHTLGREKRPWAKQRWTGWTAEWALEPIPTYFFFLKADTPKQESGVQSALWRGQFTPWWNPVQCGHPLYGRARWADSNHQSAPLRRPLGHTALPEEASTCHRTQFLSGSLYSSPSSAFCHCSSQSSAPPLYLLLTRRSLKSQCAIQWMPPWLGVREERDSFPPMSIREMQLSLLLSLICVALTLRIDEKWIHMRPWNLFFHFCCCCRRRLINSRLNSSRKTQVKNVPLLSSSAFLADQSYYCWCK